jgi:peptidoglycan/LPS O-acetylase OafA/YrhL
MPFPLSGQDSLSPIRFDELESLRGLAALLVVFNHFLQFSNQILYVPLVINGYLMVDLFFVISGFVIYSAYSERIHSAKDFSRFVFLRLGRIYPVHIIFVVIFLLIEILKLMSENTAKKAFTLNSINALWENLFLIQGVIPYGDLTYNIPSWSISVEFITYLLFGILILIFKRKVTIILLMVAIISIIMLYFKVTFGLENLLRVFAGFSLGCITALMTKKLKIKIPINTSLALISLLIGFLMMKPQTKETDLLIYPISAILIFSLILRTNDLINKILKCKFLIRLGIISYSMYMSHYFILYSMDYFFMRIILPVGNSGEIRSVSVVESSVALVVFILLVLVISWGIFVLVERPFRARSRRMVYVKG